MACTALMFRFHTQKNTSLNHAPQALTFLDPPAESRLPQLPNPIQFLGYYLATASLWVTQVAPLKMKFVSLRYHLAVQLKTFPTQRFLVPLPLSPTDFCYFQAKLLAPKFATN